MSTVTRKGQVTIPKWIRDRLDIGPGAKVGFEVDPDGTVRLVKIGGERSPGRFGGFRGTLKAGPSTDDIMRMLRPED